MSNGRFVPTVNGRALLRWRTSAFGGEGGYYRWVQRFTPLLEDAAGPCRHHRRVEQAFTELAQTI